ncbi:MAG TPA: CPBP family intramembrane glutamic endopeptidase [Verrucomicrobiae bacterium]|nr:CPBP family intramembrane glutamic endopeptidase [Verrucomicrobiae bacterium]
MTRAHKSIVFLALAFAISWAIAIGGFYSGLHETLGTTIVLGSMMAGPAIAAAICVALFERGRRVEALGLKPRASWWWLWAWLAPILLALISVAVTLMFSDRTYVDLGANIIATVEAQAPEQAAQLRAIPYLGFIQIAAAITLGALLNTPILTLTEELGWRGYLHDLWRPAGFWRASLATGAVWGLWHAPAIYLYGLNYPENRELGIGLFVIFCVMLSPMLTLIRDRSGTVWAAGLFHGTFNALGAITVLVLSDPSFPWNGIVGIGGFVALAMGLAATALLVGRPALASPPPGA